MGILPDHMLRELGPRLISPYDPTMVQPASIDVHLDRFYYRVTPYVLGHELDPSVSNDEMFDGPYEAEKGVPIIMEPDEFILASTFETVKVLRTLVARYEGKSSLARLGLLTHVTAGFIDPGFNGHITLELKNVTDVDWVLYPGMRIGQLCFETLAAPVHKPYGSSEYGSHYQGQRGPTLSRSHINFDKIDVYSST